MAKVLVIAALLQLASVTGIARTTITWWQFWTDPSVKPTIQSMVDEFEQRHPDIEVRTVDLTWANGHEKIAIALASNTGPDVLELGSDWIAQFAASDHLADLSELVSKDSGRYHGWSMATFRDRVWAKPWILGTRVLFANRDLLTRAGYDSNWVPITVTDLMLAAARIHHLADDVYGWGSNTAEKHRLYKKYLPFFWSYGAQIFTDDLKYCILASEPAVNALSLYKGLHDTSGYVADQRGIEDAFLDGRIGFIVSGDWLLKRIELEQREINLVSTLFPGLAYTGNSFLGGEFLAINAASRHQSEAMELIDFITAPENQVRFCRANRSANPSSIQAQQDPYFSSNVHLQTFIKQILSAKHPPVDPDWVYIEDAIEGAVEDALFGSRLPGEALRRARRKIVEIKGQ